MDVRVGIIGAGRVVRSRHLPALQKLAGVEVRLIWSRNPDNARRVAAEFGIPGVAAEWREVAGSPEVDAVVIAVPPVLHLPATIAAFAAGKHVLCQARMARNLREAQQMTLAAGRSGRVAALYPPRPGLKGDRLMHRLIQREGFVGQVREVRVAEMRQKEGRTTEWGMDEWGGDPRVVGVNTMNVGLYVEVLNRWVGPATRLVAMGKTHHGRRKTSAGDWIDAVVPDSLALVADLQCGATASFHFSDCAGGEPRRSIEISGSRGALLYHLYTDQILGATGGGEKLEPIAIPPEEERPHSSDAEFIRAIREGTSVSPDFEEGLRYMEFCEAVAISLMTGGVVPVPPPQAAMQCWGRSLA